MNILIEQTKQRIARIKDTATERSYYPILCEFFQDFAKSDAIKLHDAHATPEETSTQYEKNIGFPDITIRNKNELIGWIEVKMPDENLAATKFRDQFTKYRDSLENIIFTNLREWELWQWEDSQSKQIGKTVIFDLTNADGSSTEDFEQLLVRFFEGRVYQTRTPKQLALALAKKTRLLSKQVEEAMEVADEKSDLWKLKETFEKTLIQDISSHQFANMVAETMAYSLFLSALEHERSRVDHDLTLTNAIDYLPTNVPILADLYGLIKKVASSVPSIYESAQLLVDQLNASEIERIRQKLVEHKPGEDPVIQFYEPFLAEYDPKEREARGVYYTPKPVVDYIVRSVDWILRNKFGKEKGLADESVNLLDPAIGTGTFLMSAIQEIYWNTKKENEALGDEMVSREFNKVVLNHILKHFFGFELLIAPYAVAHLKLTLELERLGFDFKLSKGDGDTENDRFKVYLANTLDDPEKPPAKLFGFDSIPDESEKAQTIKQKAPILAIIGNPPYSVSSSNKGAWIQGLMDDYKAYVKSERNIQPLSDDYLKFIRFAQWKITQTGQGIFAMITNNSFLTGRIHKGVRKELLKTYDEIYVLNLHGSAVTGEIAPDGAEDQNVFSIRQGVSISFFIKLPEGISKSKSSKIYYLDLWGNKNIKFDYLAANIISTTSWVEVNLSDTDDSLFIHRDNSLDAEYNSYPALESILEMFTSGVKTHRDNLVISESKEELENNISKLKNEYSNVIETFSLRENTSFNSTTIRNSEETILIKSIRPIWYKPFDRRFIIFHKNLIERTRLPKMGEMLQDNLAFICKKGQLPNQNNYFVSNTISELRYASAPGTIGTDFVFPLYKYSFDIQDTIFKGKYAVTNISNTFSKNLAKKLGLNYLSNGRGDLETTFGPEDIFYYAYAIFHSPTYRSRYAEQIKMNFPRLPITGDKNLFRTLTGLGNELVSLHLLGENPFDSSKTILNESSKWNIKIDGIAPANGETWKISDIRYDEGKGRVYINTSQYFEGVEKEVWEFIIGSYQVCEKWLKDRKKMNHTLSTDDIRHYMKIVVSLRETLRLMKEVDQAIPGWPIN